MTAKRFVVLLALGLLILSPSALAHREAADDEEIATSSTQESSGKEYIEVPSQKVTGEEEYTGPKDFNYCKLR